MNAIRLAARLALEDAGHRMLDAVEALDEGDFEEAREKVGEAADLLGRALKLVDTLDERAGEPS